MAENALTMMSRCSTPFGIIGIRTPRWEEILERTASAQRLSASSEFAQRNRERGAKVSLVLNAFRHHRNSHRLYPHVHVRRAGVLNAFRHHRNSHKLRSIGLKVSSMCSTPFGIIGIRTEGSAAAQTVIGRCSTPFGIIGIRTPA